MPRGRPVYSLIRQRIVEILAVLQNAYGYEIYKVYRAVYPLATLRSMYYHLKKGISTGEFRIEKIETTPGDYSWGQHAEKIVYTLGSKAKAQGDPLVVEYARQHPAVSQKLNKEKNKKH